MYRSIQEYITTNAFSESIYYAPRKDQIAKSLDTFLFNPNECTAKRFALDYFEAGGKESVITSLEDLIHESDRWTHCVSMYILGCVIWQALSPHTDQILESFLSSKCNLNIYCFKFSFTYYWFLSCLFHDYGVREEENFQSNSIKNDENCYSSILNKYRIGNSLFDEKGYQYLFTYKPETYKSYLQYRMCNRRLDHGILGGLLLYDKISEIPEEKFRNAQLFWDTKISPKHIAVIADSICAHNIWHDVKQTIPQLVVGGNNEQKLNFIDNTLSYFLSLIDAIEPTKRFDNLNPKAIFENLNLEASYNNNSITISFIQSPSEVFCMRQWYQKSMVALSRGDWLANTKASIEGNQKITICIEL